MPLGTGQHLQKKDKRLQHIQTAWGSPAPYRDPQDLYRKPWVMLQTSHHAFSPTWLQ